ncbi:hypothetical protein BGX26_000806, partial [Mortierella sp. AD094]
RQSIDHLRSSAPQQLPLKRNLDPVILPTLPPKVLHLIFFHLDNTTLCNRISLVSCQFHAIAQHHIKREGIWTLGPQKDEDALLEKI